MTDRQLTIDVKRLIRRKQLLLFVLAVTVCLSLLVALAASPATAWAATAFALAAAFTLLVVGITFGAQTAQDIRDRIKMHRTVKSTGQQIEELFAMTDMLQAAEDHEDAGAVLMATAQRLLPEFGGALYVFNNSRDRLDLAKSWHHSEGFHPSETLLPGNCWALKRGKPHINDPSKQTLCCMHQIGTAATVEVPMMARGSVFGLLILAIETDDSYDRLLENRRLARALADSMSLALSNIALREKLRTQSLRDPLTGLYNRRYMEDALDRYISLAERSGTATSVVMIDLDNFKRLNDENGHAKGDAVLRDVAGQLVAALRPSDVVSRYGGEELLVILPNCGLEDALHKAEMMRDRIASLSEAHGVSISASFGVAAVPETSTGLVDVIPMADAALYAAKQAGKNCVRATERRNSAREDPQLRLAVP